MPPSRIAANPSRQEVTALKTNREFEVIDPRTIGKTLRGEFDTTTQRASAADDVLQQTIDRIDETQPKRRDLLESNVAAKTQINDDIQEETGRILAEARPLFQKREAIAKRQQDIAAMNPLKRFFKGITDLDFNEVHLRGTNQAVGNRLAALDETFSKTTQLQTRCWLVCRTNLRTKTQC